MAVVTGTSREDTLHGTQDGDILAGGDSDDLIYAFQGADTVFGGDGNDYVVSDDSTHFSVTGLFNGEKSTSLRLPWADVINLGAGDDYLEGGAGSDNIYGGTGFDVVDFGRFLFLTGGGDVPSAGAYARITPRGMVVDLDLQTATYAGGIIRLFLQAYSAEEPGFIYTTPTVGGFAQVVSGFEAVVGTRYGDRLTGTDRKDVTEIFDTGGGNDVINGKGGLDIASFFSGYGVSINLQSGSAEGFNKTLYDGVPPRFSARLLGIEGAYGSPGNDTITGNEGANTLAGGLRDDVIDGAGGYDIVAFSYGSFGAGKTSYSYGQRDSFEKSNGVFIDLGAGISHPLLANFPGGIGNDSLRGIEGVLGSRGVDSIIGNDDNNLLDGVEGNDSILGGFGRDTILGGNDRDQLSGGDSADRLFGGAGADQVNGGEGDDLLAGGEGNDTLDGGAGRDTLDYSAEDGGKGVIVSLATLEATDSFEKKDKLLSIENVKGSALADDITGSGGSNALSGGEGHDIISGGGSDDTLAGDTGNDRLFGDNGNDFMRGGDDSDLLMGGIGNDSVAGEDGADSLMGDAGNDKLYGGSGADTIDGSTGNDVLQGGDDLDTLAGGEGSDTLVAGAGDDSLLGSEGDDDLSGDDGDDRLSGNADVDRLAGGDGNDSLSGDEGSDILLGGTGNDRLSGAESTPEVDGVALVQAMSGDDGDDILFGGGQQDRMLGGQGNDTLQGAAGNDLLSGDSGQRITGYTFVGGARTAIEVGLLRSEGGDDVLDGGDGFDTASYLVSQHAIEASLMTGSATGEGTDRLVGIEGLLGSRFDDRLEGSNDDDLLSGAQGNDTIEALGGDDTILGTSGKDVINGGDGVDTLIFDAAVRALFDLRVVGNQQIYTLLTGSGAAAGDTYSGFENFFGSADSDSLAISGTGDASLSGGAGNDSVKGDKGDDKLMGGDGNDRVEGGDGRDDLSGGTGSDLILGGSGADGLIGGDGNDTLLGGVGQDTLVAGTGKDVLTGGNDADTFVFTSNAEAGSNPANADTITDFSQLEGDRIDLSLIDADSTQTGLQNFDFIAGAAFSGVAGQLRAEIGDGVINLEADTDGLDGANFVLLLTGTFSVGEADFILA